VKRLEILDELLTRDVPTIVLRQEVECPSVVFRVTLEEDTKVRVADAAEHEARHVAGS
jgi:serine kinase of HPr protein (carbohydrate metabolism regulator)